MNRLPMEWVAAIAFSAGMVFGAAAAINSNTGLPVCQEDEVLTQQRECVAVDDADYIGGQGWVTK